MMSPQYGLLAIVAIALIAGVSKASPPQRIIGGNNAVLGEFSYQASLLVNGRHHCGAVIIDNRHLLTAAHCFIELANIPLGDVLIATGSVALNGGQHHTVKSYHTHTDFSNVTKLNDIAIIALDYSINFNATQNKVELPSGLTLNHVTANVTGWGYTDGSVGVFSENLKKASTIILLDNECKEYYTDENLTDTHICSVIPSGNICYGDSGGPLVRNGQLIGIASFQHFGCPSWLPTAYTYVYKHIVWIREKISNT